MTIGNESTSVKHTRRYSGDSLLFDFLHAKGLSAQFVSEGALLILGILTAIYESTSPGLVMLDDIEHGLHPLAQKQLVAVIGQLMQRFPDLQLLATAHSPYLLNYLEPEQVRIMAIGTDGGTRCGRLSEHPKFATWKEEMAPGELWSLFGEKWVADKEAAF